MSGALLRSGSLRELKPLGAVGSPVYSAAAQLRAAVRRQIGEDAADLFAIPRQHENGDVIDWYAPQPGDVIPWSAATPEQRAAAKATLVAARERLAERGRTLQADERPERQVFGRLLARATEIPSEEHIYLVGGRPVMTFWGFHPADAPAGLDVIGSLDTGTLSTPRAPGLTASAPLDAAVPAAAVQRRSWWWLWLLLALLLLALLLLALKHCGRDVPGIIPGLFPSAQYGGDATPTTPPTVTAPGGVVVGRDGSTQLERPSGQAGETLPAGSLPTADAGIDQQTPPTPDFAGGARPTQASPEQPTPGSGTPHAQQSPAAQPPETQPPGPLTPPPGAPTVPPRTAPQRPQEGPGTGTAPAAGPAPRGTPLTIPKEAVQAGSTEFLNGQWRSITGLQDRSGNPVELHYDFDKGQGTVSLRRSVGGQEQTCTGRVGSTLKGGRLEIDQRSIRCPDGSTFQDSTVQCSVGADNKAVCTGQNSDGTRYDVNIVK